MLLFIIQESNIAIHFQRDNNRFFFEHRERFRYTSLIPSDESFLLSRCTSTVIQFATDEMCYGWKPFVSCRLSHFKNSNCIFLPQYFWSSSSLWTDPPNRMLSLTERGAACGGSRCPTGSPRRSSCSGRV